MATGRDNQPGPEEAYPDPGLAYIEQYKLYVQSADNNSARRMSVNRYQASLNAAAVALYSLTATIAPQPVVLVFIAIAGIILASTWYWTLRSIRRLNVEKFKIIHSMEERLPRAVYYEEWQGLGQADGRQYHSPNSFEQIVPVVFVALHAGALFYFGYVPARAIVCHGWAG